MAQINLNNIKKTISDLLKDMSPRNKDVISRRFGLKTGKKETLESIGASYVITRERVRQIEKATISQLGKNNRDNAEINLSVNWAKNEITKSGGVIKEEDLLRAFSGKAGNSVENSSLSFILSIDDNLIRSQESDSFHAFWAINEPALIMFKGTSGAVIKLLDKIGKAVSEQDLYALAQKNNVPGFSGGNSKNLGSDELKLSLDISKNLDKNIFNQVGLSSWSEINPKGVRDKAYLVLRKESKPCHFSRITELINRSGFSSRKANIQTVHNELIKDGRFVLVGRGLYALSEWGYRPGTVRDVLTDILKNSSRPMSKANLVAKVMDSRLVKENTILLNLQDSKTFVKNQDGTYSLK